MTNDETRAAGATKRGAVPWLSREGKFRFEMGVRQGDGSFFRASPHSEAILPARAAVLEAHPERHAVMQDDGAELLRRLREFAREAAGIDLRSNATFLADCIELGKHWEPDFLLLKPASDGLHRLVGGCVCFPSSWDVREKLGHPIHTIHVPVPTVNETLGAQINAFLSRIKPGAIWERWNWGLAAVSDMNHHPDLQLPRLHAGSTLAESWLRLEHQAFRPLDDEGGLLFAIRISVVPMTAVAQQRDAALRLAELLETMPDDIAAYKGLSSARQPLASQLREADGKPH